MWSLRSRHRLIAAVGALLVLAPTACTAATGGGRPTLNIGNAAHKKITLITGVKGDPFYITMACAAEAEARNLDMDLTVDGSEQWDASAQRAVIDSVGASRPDGLLISPVDGDALTPSLRQLQAAGTKIGLVDTSVNDPSVGITRASSDNEAGGVLAALAVAKQMGDQGSVLVISVKPGVTTTDARIKGFNEEMAAHHPRITVLPTLYDNDQPATAAAQVQSTLAAHPDLRGVFAGNTNAGRGIAAGLKQVGKQGLVKVVGFDAEPDEIASLRAGTIQVLVAQDPAGIGTQAVDQLAAAFEGRPVLKEIDTPMAAITKDDLDNPRFAKYLYRTGC